MNKARSCWIARSGWIAAVLAKLSACGDNRAGRVALLFVVAEVPFLSVDGQRGLPFLVMLVEVDSYVLR